MWTLEGLGLINKNDIWTSLTGANWNLRMQAFGLTRSVISKENYKDFVTLFNQLIQDKDELAAPYIAFLASDIKPYSASDHKNLLINLGRAFPTDLYVSDAVISSLKNEEGIYFKEFAGPNPDTALIINKRLKKVLADADKAKNNKADVALRFPRGATIFKSFCQTCHGPDGNGVTSLAPPLNNSEWVTGDKNKLSSIVLYGLTGPIQIGNKLYKAPEINGEMPGIASNDEFSDADIAQLLNYIRNSWNNKGDLIQASEIKEVRDKFRGRQKPFTMEELMK